MRGERPADAQTDAVVSEMVAAGILTVGHDIEGRETWTLTPKYAQVARQMAMSSEEDAVAMFTEILDAAEADDALSALGAHEPVIVEGDLGGSADTRFPHRQHAVKASRHGPSGPLHQTVGDATGPSVQHRAVPTPRDDVGQRQLGRRLGRSLGHYRCPAERQTHGPSQTITLMILMSHPGGPDGTCPQAPRASPKKASSRDS